MMSIFLFWLITVLIIVYPVLCLFYSAEVGLDFVPILSKNPNNPVWVTAFGICFSIAINIFRLIFGWPVIVMHSGRIISNNTKAILHIHSGKNESIFDYELKDTFVYRQYKKNTFEDSNSSGRLSISESSDANGRLSLSRNNKKVWK